MIDTSKIFDYIVVGSGCTGVQSAQTLLENGAEVLMLDVGNEDESGISFPNKDFLNIRKENTNQPELFLGKNYIGIPWGELKPGYHLTPSRKYVIKDTEELAPYTSNEFEVFESFAKGGLGTAWGTGSYLFTKEELEKSGLSPDEMDSAYKTMFERIGITEGNHANNYPEEVPLETDKSIQKIQKSYHKNQKYFNTKEIHLKRTPLAVISSPKENRKAYEYNDMDFWHDNNKSAYRPWITLNELKTNKNFSYVNNAYVYEYKEVENQIEVTIIHTKTQEKVVYFCKKLMLGASVFGTTRIVLRSTNNYNKKLSLLCNSYFYIPCINLKMLGKLNSKKKIGLSQLTLYIKNKKHLEIANFFTYRSLLLFKLVKESPLNIKVSRLLFKFLHSSIVIVGFHISKTQNHTDQLVLEKDDTTITNDKLRFITTENNEEKTQEKGLIKRLKKILFKLKCIPLKVIQTTKGSSIHYAGTLPFSNDEKPLTTNLNGKLSGSKNIYIIDASSFTFLPAKGVTLTAMANAHRVSLKSLEND
ncbi:GMC oxidoreductase [Tenacibaculum sp. 190524A05c]|uniref:GMC oxidoreductase n=1 Tax=Tenacibaculum platacis TaxID=3137852 RepID=UPI0031FAB5F9